MTSVTNTPSNVSGESQGPIHNEKQEATQAPASPTESTTKAEPGRKDKGEDGPDIDISEALNKSYNYPIASVLRALGIEDTDHGLNDSVVTSRKEEFGPNQLEGSDEISIFRIMLNQIANAMTLVSTVISFRSLRRFCARRPEFAFGG